MANEVLSSSPGMYHVNYSLHSLMHLDGSGPIMSNQAPVSIRALLAVGAAASVAVQEAPNPAIGCVGSLLGFQNPSLFVVGNLALACGRAPGTRESALFTYVVSYLRSSDCFRTVSDCKFTYAFAFNMI